MLHNTFAGLPTTTLPSGIFPFTILPAPIMLFLPIVVLGSITARDPTKTFSFIVIVPSILASVLVYLLSVGGGEKCRSRAIIVC